MKKVIATLLLLISTNVAIAQADINKNIFNMGVMELNEKAPMAKPVYWVTTPNYGGGSTTRWYSAPGSGGRCAFGC